MQITMCIPKGERKVGDREYKRDKMKGTAEQLRLRLMELMVLGKAKNYDEVIDAILDHFEEARRVI